MDSLGYSGISSTIKTQSGIYGEIQVNSPAMIYAKEPETLARVLLGNDVYNTVATQTKVPGGLGHHLYEQWRAPNVNPSEAKIIAEKSKAYYDAIRNTYAN